MSEGGPLVEAERPTWRDGMSMPMSGYTRGFRDGAGGLDPAEKSPSYLFGYFVGEDWRTKLDERLRRVYVMIRS